LRTGNVDRDDVVMVRQLIVRNPKHELMNFSKPPWDNACLITPRHGVWLEWNRMALEKHCQATEQKLLICTTKDLIGKRNLSIVEQYAVTMRGKGKNKGSKVNDLPEKVELAIGMKVMLTQNIQMDLDITNGACRTIVDIILHTDEPDLGTESIVPLRHLPAFILVKLNRTQ
ncbi:hypothetical protein BDQ17DRAFT_1188186, partial [Cyathus striatus]